jgi:hypothetical protein
MLWIKQPGLRETIEDKNGTIWFFKYWSDIHGKDFVQRVYFWDSEKKVTGLMELKDGKTIHWKKIKDRVIKLIKDKSYREQFLCQLKFPIESNY